METRLRTRRSRESTDVNNTKPRKKSRTTQSNGKGSKKVTQKEDVSKIAEKTYVDTHFDSGSLEGKNVPSDIKGIVLDIEGTVCPISFVKDVLFPYAIEEMNRLVPNLQFPIDLNTESPLLPYLEKFPEETVTNADTLLDHVKDLTAKDLKIGYWKALQGHLWTSGYESGKIKAPIYKDALFKMPQWAEQLAVREGKNPKAGVYIYSSGSVAAQKMIFGYCAGEKDEVIDLNKHLKGYYDTSNAGPKTESKSYEIISDSIGIKPRNLLFFSDNVKEIEAAKAAGWHTRLTVRPGNAKVDNLEDYEVVYNFDNIDF
jgi:enolase-phosphatase E1